MNQMPINSGNNFPMPANLGTATAPVISQPATTSTPTPTPTPNINSSSSSTSNPAIAKVLLGIIPLLIFTATGIISYSIVNNQKQTVSYQSSAKETTKITVQEQSQKEISNVSQQEMATISATVLEWVDKAKDENGVYFTSVNCENNECKKGFKSNVAGAPVIWARFQNYLKTKDVNEIAKIQKDFSIYLDPVLVPDIQSKTWSCKLLYEIAQSNDSKIAELQKQLSDLCKRNLYHPMTDTLIVAGQDQEPDLTKTGSAGKDQISTKQNEYSETIVLSSEFSARYLWFKDANDLKKAKQLFIKALAYYDSKFNDVNGNNSMLGVAALDLFSATKDNKYKQFAINVLNEKINKPCDQLANCIMSTYLSNKLFEIDNNINFKNAGKKFINEAVFSGFDSTKAFHTFSTIQTTYRIFDNSLLVGLLLKF